MAKSRLRLILLGLLCITFLVIVQGVAGVGSREGAGIPRLAAAQTSVRKSSTLRCC